MSSKLWCIGTVIGNDRRNGVDWTQNIDEMPLTPFAIEQIEHQLSLLSDIFFLTEPQELIILQTGSGLLDLRRRRPGNEELIIGNALWNLTVGEMDGSPVIGHPSEVQAAA